MLALSCKSNEQKAQTQYINNLRQLSPEQVKAYQDSITLFMDTLLNNTGFSGGILVAKNGTVLYEHYQGYSDGEQQTPINDSTPFHVASTSKTFTSTAIMQLVKAGKLKITDSLRQYFPGFPYEGITVKHLLSHTSGLQNYAFFLPKYKWNPKVTATNKDVLDIIIGEKPPLTHPVGSRFEYCNTNFVLLALIVEQLSGKAFPDYVKEHIFVPAGMSHSFIMGANDTDRYLPSFKANKAMYNFDYLDAIYGDKNVYTTCKDLMQYDAAIRNHLLLDSASYETVWEPQQPDKHYHDSSEFYGMGWRLKIWPGGNKIVYHNGWWHGNNSVFQRVYQDTAVIIVTGNVFNRRIYHVPHVANVFRPYYEDMNFEREVSEGDSTGTRNQTEAVKQRKAPAKNQKQRKRR